MDELSDEFLEEHYALLMRIGIEERHLDPQQAEEIATRLMYALIMTESSGRYPDYDREAFLRAAYPKNVGTQE